MNNLYFKELFLKITFLGTVLLFSMQAAKAQNHITIEQAINKALQNNLNIKKAINHALTAEINLKQSKAAIFPNLSGSSNDNLSFGRGMDQTTFQIVNQNLLQINGNISVSVDLFGGGTKINQIKQNKILLDASKSAEEKAKNDLILQVVTAYMQIVYNEDLLQASKQQLEVARQTALREHALLDAGNKTLADISQAMAQVATAELNITNIQNNLTMSYLTLAQLMELQPEDAEFTTVLPIMDGKEIMSSSLYDVTSIYKTALLQFPDIKLAELNRQAAEKQISIAKGGLYPSISLQSGLNSSYSYRFNSLISQESFTVQIRDRFNQNVGFGLQIPIFNGLSTSSNIKKAKISFENAKLDEQLAKNNLLKVIAQAVADVKAAESNYLSTQKTFNAQNDAFEVIKERYNVGLVNSLNFNTAQTNRNKAEVDFIQAKYNLLFKIKIIDYYLGKQIKF